MAIQLIDHLIYRAENSDLSEKTALRFAAQGAITPSELRTLEGMIQAAKANRKATKLTAAQSNLRSAVNSAGLGGVLDFSVNPDGSVTLGSQILSATQCDRAAQVVRDTVAAMGAKMAAEKAEKGEESVPPSLVAVG